MHPLKYIAYKLGLRYYVSPLALPFRASFCADRDFVSPAYATQNGSGAWLPPIDEDPSVQEYYMHSKYLYLLTAWKSAEQVQQPDIGCRQILGCKENMCRRRRPEMIFISIHPSPPRKA